jgi:hypothetical protein
MKKTVATIAAVVLAASCAPDTTEETGAAPLADTVAVCGCMVNVPPAGFTTICGASGVDECVYAITPGDIECVHETGCTHPGPGGVTIVHPVDEVVFRYTLVPNAAGLKPACCPTTDDKRNRCKGPAVQ